MKKLLLLILLPLQVRAMEQIFEGNATTSLGSVILADQPAGLAWLPQKWSFSATANSLNQTQYEESSQQFQGSESPLTIKPLVVATGKGYGWGGWAAEVATADDDVRLSSVQTGGGKSTDAGVRRRLNLIRGSIAFGMRLGDSWALGWAGHLLQTQQDSYAQSSEVNGADKTLVFSESTFKRVSAQVSMAALYDLSNFRLGLVLTTPNESLTSKGQQRTKTVNTQLNILSDQTSDFDQSDTRDWTIDAGVRFGREGSAFLLADRYLSSGSHKGSFAYEYRATWGLITGSVSREENESFRHTNVVVGFVHKSENFDWGIGPSFEDAHREGVGAISARSYNVLYASEIRF